jgi:hypothetical protein
MDSSHVQLRRHAITHVEAFDVTQDEIEGMERAAGDTGLDFQIAQFAFTLAASFLVALLTTQIESRRTFDVFVIIVVVGFFGGIAFGVRWYKNRGAFGAIVRRIKERQIGPVGDEGKELKAAELAELPSQKAEPVK